PSARGWLAFNTKRTVRRLGSWYIEPRWHAQREIDAEIARFATDSAAAIERPVAAPAARAAAPRRPRRRQMSLGAVHQFHSGTGVGDAITNQMFDLQR